MLNYYIVNFIAFNSDNFSKDFIKALYNKSIPPVWTDNERTLKEHIFSTGWITDALDDEANSNHPLHNHIDTLNEIKAILEPLSTEYFRIDDLDIELIQELEG